MFAQLNNFMNQRYARREEEEEYDDVVKMPLTVFTLKFMIPHRGGRERDDNII